MSRESRIKYLRLMASMGFWLAAMSLPAAAGPLQEGSGSPPSAPAVGKDASKPTEGESTVEPALPVVVPSEPFKPKEESKSFSGGKPPALPAATAAKESDPAPALKHLAASGAKLTELGTSHGLRGILARRGEEFMLFQLTPVHGLRGLFVRDGAQFQVFYATPDGERLIPGVMWDASGKNTTRDQVAQIPGWRRRWSSGTHRGTSSDHGGEPKPALDLVGKTSFGLICSDDAPRLWMFVDPLCSFSVRAMQEVKALAARKEVQVAVIPVSVLDYETQGQSTPAAMALLSKPGSDLVASWDRGDFKGPAAPEAAARLEGNMAVASAIRLRGTPTVIWRKATDRKAAATACRIGRRCWHL